MASTATLEFFGMTTFRLKAKGITIFHDTWLDKPPLMKRFLELEDVTEVDYIFISHAHFDHLPGADQLALKTGAIVIGNAEAIRCLRDAGVPEEQLVPVAGGERIPLFTKQIRDQAATGTVKLAPGIPGSPPQPHPDLASMSVDVWPSLHGLLPSSLDALPEIFDTGEVFTGSVTQFDCTLDITRLMQYGLFRLADTLPSDKTDAKTQAFASYFTDRKKHVMSHCDGGQLLYNVLVDGKAVLFNSHSGAYDGIMQTIQPKPDVAVLGIAGRGNLNGRPFEGSVAQFAVEICRWLGEPEKVVWSLHDESLIKPFRVDTTAAERLLEQNTRSRAVDIGYATPYALF